MNNKMVVILSVISILLPIVSVIINLHFEPELTEAIAAGLIEGCAAGSVTGGTALILNKGKNTLVTLLSVLPIIVTIVFIVLWVPYYAFG